MKRHPRSRNPAAAVVAAAAGLTGSLALGCGANTPTYFQPPGPIEVGAMNGPRSGRATVALPFRAPDDEEAAALADDSGRLGFAAPWLRRDRIALSIQYTITNLSDKDGTAQILVDGANEITSYDAAAMRAALIMAGVREQDADVLSLHEATPVIVPAGATRSGTIREDHFDEIALDLDAIGRWMAAPPAVLINPSELNPAGLEMVPADVIVPALHTVIVSFSATRHMRLEFVVRVRDEKDQLARGNDDLFAPTPMAYTLMAPPAGM